jgi:hypothetical protein
MTSTREKRKESTRRLKLNTHIIFFKYFIRYNLKRLLNNGVIFVPGTVGQKNLIVSQRVAQVVFDYHLQVIDFAVLKLMVSVLNELVGYVYAVVTEKL